MWEMPAGPAIPFYMAVINWLIPTLRRTFKFLTFGLLIIKTVPTSVDDLGAAVPIAVFIA